MLGFRLLSEKNVTKMIAQSDRSALYNYFFLQNDRSFYRHGAVLVSVVSDTVPSFQSHDKIQYLPAKMIDRIARKTIGESRAVILSGLLVGFFSENKWDLFQHWHRFIKQLPCKICEYLSDCFFRACDTFPTILNESFLWEKTTELKWFILLPKPTELKWSVILPTDPIR